MWMNANQASHQNRKRALGIHWANNLPVSIESPLVQAEPSEFCFRISCNEFWFQGDFESQPCRSFPFVLFSPALLLFLAQWQRPLLSHSPQGASIKICGKNIQVIASHLFLQDIEKKRITLAEIQSRIPSKTKRCPAIAFNVLGYLIISEMIKQQSLKKLWGLYSPLNHKVQAQQSPRRW